MDSFIGMDNIALFSFPHSLPLFLDRWLDTVESAFPQPQQIHDQKLVDALLSAYL